MLCSRNDMGKEICNDRVTLWQVINLAGGTENDRIAPS